jgi:hypothetical protein
MWIKKPKLFPIQTRFIHSSRPDLRQENRFCSPYVCDAIFIFQSNLSKQGSCFGDYKKLIMQLCLGIKNLALCFFMQSNNVNMNVNTSTLLWIWKIWCLNLNRGFTRFSTSPTKGPWDYPHTILWSILAHKSFPVATLLQSIGTKWRKSCFCELHHHNITNMQQVVLVD